MIWDDFLFRAAIAGIGVALIAGPIGCLAVWRRLAYFGDTLAHAALFGVLLSLLFQLETILGVFVVAILAAVTLDFLERRRDLPSDTLLGLLSHSFLAIGLVLLSLLDPLGFDLVGLLFGDILAVSMQDIVIIYAVGAILLIVLACIWRRLLASTINRELAEAEGGSTRMIELTFLLLLASLVAISMKIVGILLVTALLIIPAAAARMISDGPEKMAALASLMGVGAVLGGLASSWHWDIPAGSSIVSVAALLFFLLLIFGAKLRRIMQWIGI